MHDHNGTYTGEHLNRVAFPLGGIGAGMVCIEGNGMFSHLSIANRPDVFQEPCMFNALYIKQGERRLARVMEGPVQDWKVFGTQGTGNGGSGKHYGLPRFASTTFSSRFPFGTIELQDADIPVRASIEAWSPFIPLDADSSSLPLAGLRITFTNTSEQPIDAVYYFLAKHFLARENDNVEGVRTHTQAVTPLPGGFELSRNGPEERPWEQASFGAMVLDDGAKADLQWFRGGWWDPLTMAWKDVSEGKTVQSDRYPHDDPSGPSPGATVSLPFSLAPGETRTIDLLLTWYVPYSNLRLGRSEGEEALSSDCNCREYPEGETHSPWYAGQFGSIQELTRFAKEEHDWLIKASRRFSDTLFASTIPPEALEAVAQNLAILKSPTVLRQKDGRLWCFEGCCDAEGCCHGTCTHVWNYAQALPHLFPDLERTLRETEHMVSQDERGHQNFRTGLPIRQTIHDNHAAADGQLGGIIKVYREWRICGDTEWLRSLWPAVKRSLDYCIQTWDPDHTGVLIEPHHNTYDIEFWGPDGMCTSFYLAALKGASEMAVALGEEGSHYSDLADLGRRYLGERLFDGEYYFQDIQWEGLRAGSPLETKSLVGDMYSPEARSLMEKEGPKYQYGKGCISDGVLGAWMGATAGIGPSLDEEKVGSTLASIHRYNFKKDLWDHTNPQRPTYALGHEGGLLLCTWPKGEKLSLPFVYSDEVWTGIEHQVASHLIMEGMVQEGLDILRASRERYDGRIRNPFNEYECGHWYARALAAYAYLQAFSGARYDAVEKVLHLRPRMEGDFSSFLCTATGYGLVGIRGGEPFLDVVEGTIPVDRFQMR